MVDHAHNMRTQSWESSGPIGVRTRGTTGYNRLRKSDRWTVSQTEIYSQLRHSRMRTGSSPLAIDVGYGASHTTTCEWASWLRRISPDIRVVGLEIAPERILPPQQGVHFALGGFELAGMKADLVRAFNVLRQYDISEVEQAWATMRAGLKPGGFLIEGTCDELGRRASWVLLDENGPQSLTLACSPGDIQQPSDIAERLPKILIHNNHPGNAIYDLFQGLDAAWNQCAGFSVFGPRVRWRETCRLFAQSGAPAIIPRRRLSDCLISFPWEAVLD